MACCNNATDNLSHCCEMMHAHAEATVYYVCIKDDTPEPKKWFYLFCSFMMVFIQHYVSVNLFWSTIFSRQMDCSSNSDCISLDTNMFCATDEPFSWWNCSEAFQDVYGANVSESVWHDCNHVWTAEDCAEQNTGGFDSCIVGGKPGWTAEAVADPNICDIESQNCRFDCDGGNYWFGRCESLVVDGKQCDKTKCKHTHYRGNPQFSPLAVDPMSRRHHAAGPVSTGSCRYCGNAYWISGDTLGYAAHPQMHARCYEYCEAGGKGRKDFFANMDSCKLQCDTDRDEGEWLNSDSGK